MSYEFSDILNLLPHRHPFLFIDKIVSVELGQTIHAQKNVTINEDFFNGHFPNKPVMPGVLIIEALGPADIEEVEIDEDTKSAKVIVKDNQLSLAIGKEGQNARLAAKLTGYKIDIEGLGDSPPEETVEETVEEKNEEEE